MVGSIFLLSEFVVTTPDESEASKQLFRYFHAPRIPRPVEGRKAGEGGGGELEPLEFLEVQNTLQ